MQPKQRKKGARKAKPIPAYFTEREQGELNGL